MTRHVLIALAALLLAGCAPQADVRSGYVKPRPAPDFALAGADGQTVKLADLKGKKPVVLEFFATWCPVCMSHVAQFKDFQQRHVGDKLAFYALSVDKTADVVDEWMKRDAVNYAVLLDSQGAASASYGASAIPRVIGINTSGDIIYADVLLPTNLDEFISRLQTPTAPAQP